MGVMLAFLLTVVLPPPDYAPIPTGLHATVRWQYGCEAARQTLAALAHPGWHNWIADDCGLDHHTPTVYGMAGEIDDADANQFWLVGSEPNVPATAIAPADAAAWAQQWTAQNDARWACCGTLQHLQHPALLEWLDGYLAAGGPIPDAWHIHIYFVSNGAQWDATVRQVREWMQARDVVRPLIVSETGQTEAADAAPLLERVAQAVCRGDVAATFWYPGDRDAYEFAPQSQLTVDGQRTALGDLFVARQDCDAEPPTSAPPIAQPQVWRVFAPVVVR